MYWLTVLFLFQSEIRNPQSQIELIGLIEFMVNRSQVNVLVDGVVSFSIRNPQSAIPNRIDWVD